jgi:RPA family protein
MTIERMVAYKVKIADLSGGEWVKKEGMEPSYVVIKRGDKVGRARLLATVVSKFVSEDRKFASMTLDDGSGTIRVKSFNEIKPVEKSEEGSVVDAIGKVREWNGEIYVVPETVTKVSDPNLETLRMLELEKLARRAGAAPKETLLDKLPSKDKSPDLRTRMINLLKDSRDGLTYAELIEKSGSTENEAEPVINDLLSEGVCYEPTPGRVRKI